MDEEKIKSLVKKLKRFVLPALSLVGIDFEKALKEAPELIKTELKKKIEIPLLPGETKSIGALFLKNDELYFSVFCYADGELTTGEKVNYLTRKAEIAENKNEVLLLELYQNILKKYNII